MPPRSEYEGHSTLGLTPPKLRGSKQTVNTWLEYKRDIDGAEGLWRIHDGLYDLTDFIDRHPGGAEWLELTKGTDCTEAFEAHHISTAPEEMLKKFFIRCAKTKRNAPFTFKEAGFYKTLKREIREVLKTVPKQPINTTAFLTDSLTVLIFIFSILANYYWNFALAFISGVLLGMLAVAAHNYIHMRDNFRMNYFTLSLNQVREWRISHILSHHLHTNTIDDLEISMWEPYFQYLPTKKKPVFRYGSFIYGPLIWMTGFHLGFISRTVATLKGENGTKPADLFGFSLPIVMYLFGGHSILSTLGIWTFIVVCSSTYLFVVGLHAAHHHPDIFHDGDTPRATEDYDWGLSQLDAVMDRKEITGSHFLVLTNFGDHALHHLFPTLDHGALSHLYPTFYKVLEKFNVNLRMVSQLDTFIGGYQQLARTSTNPNPPDLMKKY